MLDTRNGSRKLIGLVVATLTATVACGDYEESQPVEAEPTNQALAGVIQTSGCSYDEQGFLIKSVDAARFIVVSKSFHSCISQSMNKAYEVLHDGGTAINGPYRAYTGLWVIDDPYANSGPDHGGGHSVCNESRKKCINSQQVGSVGDPTVIPSGRKWTMR